MLRPRGKTRATWPGSGLIYRPYNRFLSSPIIIGVPFFLLFGLNKRTLEKKAKGYYSGT